MGSRDDRRRIQCGSAPALLCLLALVGMAGPARALEISRSVLNLGGGARTGSLLSVPNDALGDSVSGSMVSSSGRFRIDPALTVDQPPPPSDEVQNLTLRDWFLDTRLEWDAVPGASAYNVYRAEFAVPLANPPAIFDAYVCGETGTHYDEWQYPALNEVYAYVISSVIGDDESGIGRSSTGVSRSKGTPCP